jgi:hypothetical protein
VAAPAEVVPALPDGPQVTAPAALDAALGLHRVAGGIAIHVLRYAYDAAADRVPELDELELSVRLADVAVTGAEAVPSGVGVELRSHGPVHTLRLRHVPLYTVVILRTDRA